MIKLNGKAFVAALILGGTFALTNCSSATSNTTTTKSNAENTAVAVNSKTANSTTDVAKNNGNENGKIGIAECDEYVEKYEACVNTKVPKGQRANFMSSFNSMREAWKKTVEGSSDPSTKAALAAGCKQSLEGSKKMMASFACTW
jgi:hypothetical protein